MRSVMPRSLEEAVTLMLALSSVAGGFCAFFQP